MPLAKISMQKHSDLEFFN